MNRRGFLRLLGMAAAGAAAGGMELDPERLLWRPGAKTFFLPSIESVPDLFFHGPHPERGFRSRYRGRNVLLTPEMITREAFRVLQDNMAFVKQINRDYDRQFGGGAVGYTSEHEAAKTLRRPTRFASRRRVHHHREEIRHRLARASDLPRHERPRPTLRRTRGHGRAEGVCREIGFGTWRAPRVDVDGDYKRQDTFRTCWYCG